MSAYVLIKKLTEKQDQIEAEIKSLEWKVERTTKEWAEFESNAHLMQVIFAELHPTAIHCLLWK